MISRRRLLKAGLGTAVAAPMLRGRKASATVADVDVIVIGAGFAGLAAAKRLTAMGYQTVVLEAASHPGGRVKTDWSLDAPFEVGAGWIHKPDGNPISQLAAEVDADPFKTVDESNQIFRANGDRISSGDLDAAYTKFENLLDRIDDEIDPDMSLAKAISRYGGGAENDEIVRWMTSAYTEFSTGGPLEKLSAYYFDEDKEFGGQDVILKKGYDTIVKHLARGLDIRFNTRATSVSYEKGEGAAVSTNVGDFESYYVICTVPLGVLKAGDVRFDPPLPASHRDSIQRIGMGNVTKLALKFDTAFWPTDIQYFGLTTAQRGRWNYFLNYYPFSKKNILLGLSVGNYAQKVEAMSDSAMIDDAMDAVRSMFGSSAPRPSAHRLTRWSQDPNTKGAYSYTAVGSTPVHFDRLAAPIEDVLLLAGEHTEFNYHATVHGAYMSGQKAASIVAERLKNKS